LKEEHKLRVFDNVVLRKIFGTKRDKVTEELRRVHNEELYDLYSSPNITCNWMIKSRMRWMGYVACIGNRRCAYRVWRGALRERNHLEDLDLHVGG